MQHLSVRLSVAVITFLLGITSSNMVSSLRSHTAFNSEVEREVLQAEQEYIRAHTERDVSALDRVLADDFTAFNGRMNKAQRLAMLASPDFTIISLSTTDVRVHAEGDEAWVIGKARMIARRGDREFVTPPYAYTRHYERRRGRWQVVSFSVSRMLW